MKELETLILQKLKAATDSVVNAKGIDVLDLTEPHPEFPHCERYVVDLVDQLKRSIVSFGFDVSKSKLVKIYHDYSGCIGADESRCRDIMRTIS